MKKLTINITGKEQDNLVYALEDVLRLVKEGYAEAVNSNESGRFSFKINEE